MKKVFMFILGTFVICNFCQKDFLVLKRHQWRCKSKTSTMELNERNDNSTSLFNNAAITIRNRTGNTNDSDDLKCACGKKCKGLRGLKAHQRTCKTIKTISNSNYNTFDDEIDDNEPDISDLDITNETPNFKQGIILPKSYEDWKIANDFFKSYLPTNDIISKNIDELAENFSFTVYNYFKENFGIVNDSSAENKDLALKYKSLSNGQMKSTIKKLKNKNAPVNEIRFLSKLLRQRLKTLNSLSSSSVDHDLEINNHFWGYCKKFIDKPLRILPSFDVKKCHEYFHKSFSCTNKNIVYTISDWIPSFPSPSVPFNHEKPSFSDITKIVKRMKASGSPCPIDQISVIVFKRC